MKILYLKKNVSAIAIAFVALSAGSIDAQNNNVLPTSGNVGLGTTSPSRKFQIHSTTSKNQMYVSSVTPSIFLGDNATIGSAAKMGTLSMTTEANMFAFGTESGDMILASKTGKLHFITGGSFNTSGFVRMTVGTDKITVGTSSNSFGLEVFGSSSNCLKLNAGTDQLLVSPTTIQSNKTLSINNGTGNFDIIMCQFTGKVGIGNNNPSEKLDVAGSIKVGDGGLNSMVIDGQKIESVSNLLINSGSRQNVGIGTDSPTSTLEINGMDNDGTNAALKITTAGTTQGMLLDGNEIDGLTSLQLNANSHKNVQICKNGGDVGIGTGSPTARLQINGDPSDGVTGTLKLKSGSQTMLFDGNQIDVFGGQMHLNNNSQGNVVICENGGSVGIGTTLPSSSYRLSVNGGIRAKEITVETNWSDFVFGKGYDLKSLKMVEDYITEHGHLPEIPNAKEVAENGVKVGEIESKLLMKIEELTLYIIDLNKQVQELKK